MQLVSGGPEPKELIVDLKRDEMKRLVGLEIRTGKNRHEALGIELSDELVVPDETIIVPVEEVTSESRTERDGGSEHEERGRGPDIRQEPTSFTAPLLFDFLGPHLGRFSGPFFS